MEPAIEGLGGVPAAVLIVWGIGLAVVIALVPLVVALLQRTLDAALSIRRYLAEMEQAGAGIADNTEATSTLEVTQAVAGRMLQSAGALQEHSAGLAATLSRRLDATEKLS